MKPINIIKQLNESEELELDEYKKFKHIDDVWKYLEGSKSEEDLKQRIKEINPKKFGSFTYTVNGGCATVINDYDGDIDKNDICFNESNLKESSILVDKPVFMNTWANYNEYGGLDLETKYGIKDGWMTIDDALEFCEKYAEDEPFICDTDGVPIEISNYDNAVEKLNELKEIEEADVDEDVFQAYIEMGSYSNVQDIIDKINSGDYIFFPGVDNDEDLARAYIDMCGGITAAIGEDRLGSYFDEDEYKSEIEDDIREVVRENEGYESIDDVSDEELQSYLDSIVSEEIEVAKYDHNDSFFESHFDYEAFGDELSYDYTYTSTGALCDL